MFAISLSCRRLIVGVEQPASSDYISRWIIVITVGFIWSVLSAVALRDKVNKQKETTSEDKCLITHGQLLSVWFFHRDYGKVP